MAHQSEAHLAPYAVRSEHAGGRQHPEPADPLRSPFELDRHRIIESTAFRRLEGKTQVFLASHHDHFRTRLTHTLEAAALARTLAVGLRANEHLTEAITLAHDLGHPPFGHAGEVALDEAMADHGGFNHNVHSLRVVEYLEHPFPAFRGLNLSTQTRAGLAAHTTRYDSPGPVDRAACPSVEAQIASLADRIAYNCHDLEDAIGAEFVTLEDLAELALWEEALATTTGRSLQHTSTGRTSIHGIRRAVLDTLLDTLLADAIEASLVRLTSIGSPGAAVSGSELLVDLSAQRAEQLDRFEEFLAEHLYQQPDVVGMDTEGRRVVRSLFAAYRKNPDALPKRFATRIPDQGVDRVICDYLAGMTDRFCRALVDASIEQNPGTGGPENVCAPVN